MNNDHYLTIQQLDAIKRDMTKTVWLDNLEMDGHTIGIFIVIMKDGSKNRVCVPHDALVNTQFQNICAMQIALRIIDQKEKEYDNVR